MTHPQHLQLGPLEFARLREELATTLVMARCSGDFQEEDKGYQTKASQLSVVARVLLPAPWVSAASDRHPSSQ